MSDLVRMSFSIEQNLFDKLEELVAQSGYTNRSEFVRDMIRQQLVQRQWDKNQEVVGTVTLIYDHHARQLSEKLTDLQHQAHHSVLATTHVHLTHDLCAEMIMMRGKASKIRQLADQMRQHRGVLFAELSAATTGSALK